MPEWLTILIKVGLVGALIAAIGRVIVQVLKNRDAKEARVHNRNNQIADRQLQSRRDAYNTLLEEMSSSMMHQLSGVGDRPLSSEEFQKRIRMMRDIDLYGSAEVKALSANVAQFLKRDITQDEHPKLIEAMQRMSARMREELES